MLEMKRKGNFKVASYKVLFIYIIFDKLQSSIHIAFFLFIQNPDAIICDLRNALVEFGNFTTNNTSTNYFSISSV